MSLVVAVPFGIASATVYGASIVVQHRTAQEHAGEGGESASGLLRLIKNPIFLLAIGGDFIGFLLQITALATGPVVVIQPLVVLMLPVALAVGSMTGGHRPSRGDYLSCVGIIGGLGVFLALIGAPASTHVPKTRFVGLAVIIVLVVGLILCVAVIGRSKTIRGAMYGGVAGVYFGVLAVMIDGASEQISRHGLQGLLTHPRGLVVLAGALLVGVPGMILTQMSFQVGALAATLPANIATDPFTAVALGAILLREHIPHSTGHLIAYGLCLLAVVAGAIGLADPDSRSGEHDAHPHLDGVPGTDPAASDA